MLGHLFFFFFLMIRRPPRSTLSSSSAASDVYKRQIMIALPKWWLQASLSCCRAKYASQLSPHAMVTQYHNGSCHNYGSQPVPRSLSVVIATMMAISQYHDHS
eukprot:TRINITY_DN10200_c0_g1_i3.p1 TRINITY_DN10200_c0_g1~~TRINITY_DN10200_c0_g1_i3.p1  ORF type:complete len:103 (-),score=19.52 TRINITY_DN10200_c0_g1_i3:278-586(-)